MRPYYSDELVTLYHGDSIDLADMWTAADVLVTDPPYGMAYRDRQGVSIANDDTLDARDAALKLWGSKPALCFGTWKVERPAATRQVLVWDKWGGGGTVGSPSSPWAYSHEEIYMLGDWPKLKPGGRAREGGKPSRTSGVLRVANYNTQARDRPDHPTPKPVALMESLIERCPDGVIADPFAGSGSTLVAAKNLGRRAVGVELDERYCELIAQRCSAWTLDFAA
jgi:site-specific DNA-methyltransferase (adenine-specific)